MINYCIDYIYQDGDYVESATISNLSEQDREDLIKS